MGLIKGGLFLFCATLLLFSLVAMNFSLILSSSTSLDNIKSNAVLNSDIINQESGVIDYLNENEEIIKSHCENNTDYVFSHNTYTAGIPCETVINDFSDAEKIVIESSMEKLYYKEYSCDFISCVVGLENPLYIISEESHNYWNSKFYLFLLSSIIFSGLVIFFGEKKSNSIIILGALFMISSLPFFKINLLIPSEEGLFTLVLNILSSTAIYVAVVVFLVGAFISSLGIGIKFWHLGKFFSRLFGKNKE